MIVMAREITPKGDAYGFTSKRGRGKEFTATRTFIIQVDSSPDRGIDEVLNWLPQENEPHPYVPEATVVEVKVVSDQTDPHIYHATVEYGESGSGADPDGKKEDDTNPEYPWNKKAETVFSSDNSIKEVDDNAYAVWEYLGYSGSSANAGEFIQNSSPISISAHKPTIPIVVRPTNEKFSSLPEETAPCFGLQVRIAVKGYKTISQRKFHDSSIVEAFTQQCFTVNQEPANVFGYNIGKFCGYLSQFTIVPKYYINRWKRMFAYYDISFNISYNPATWVRLIQNMSLNHLTGSYGDEDRTLTHIKIVDADTGALERITKPLFIHPQTGVCPAVTDGQFDPAEDMVYVVPYLTKRPDAWAGIRQLHAENQSR